MAKELIRVYIDNVRDKNPVPKEEAGVISIWYDNGTHVFKYNEV